MPTPRIAPQHGADADVLHAAVDEIRERPLARPEQRGYARERHEIGHLRPADEGMAERVVHLRRPAEHAEEMAQALGLVRKLRDQSIAIIAERPADADLELRETQDVVPVRVELAKEGGHVEPEARKKIVHELPGTASADVMQTRVENEAVPDDGREISAELLPRLEREHVEAVFREKTRRGEARRTSTDDDRAT